MGALQERLLNVWRKRFTATTQECCEQYWTSPGGSTPQNSRCTATYHPSRKLSKIDESDIRNTAGEVGTNSKVTYSCGPPHIDEQRQDNQLEPTYNSAVPIPDVALKTYRKWRVAGEGQGDPCWWRDMLLLLMMMMIYKQMRNMIKWRRGPLSYNQKSLMKPDTFDSKPSPSSYYTFIHSVVLSCFLFAYI